MIDRRRAFDHTHPLGEPATRPLSRLCRRLALSLLLAGNDPAASSPVGLRPIPRCARDQHCVLSCALGLVAPDTRTAAPSDVFNRGIKDDHPRAGPHPAHPPRGCKKHWGGPACFLSAWTIRWREPRRPPHHPVLPIEHWLRIDPGVAGRPSGRRGWLVWRGGGCRAEARPTPDLRPTSTRPPPDLHPTYRPMDYPGSF